MQKSGVSDFCKTKKKFDERDVEGAVPHKKRPIWGRSCIIFCSEWCKWYACFVEDSYLAIVEPVISCIERFSTASDLMKILLPFMVISAFTNSSSLPAISKPPVLRPLLQSRFRHGQKLSSIPPFLYSSDL